MDAFGGLLFFHCAKRLQAFVFKAFFWFRFSEWHSEGREHYRSDYPELDDWGKSASGNMPMQDAFSFFRFENA